MRQTPRPLPPDPRLDQALRLAVAAGALLTLVLPWRSQWLGLTLLWLLVMPLSAWWALHRFRLPAPRRLAEAARRLRPRTQARRCRRPARQRLARAA